MDDGRIPVVVTTEFRGVFFGYAAEDEIDNPEKLKLTNCRCAMYWTTATRGFLGLAAAGPREGSRIGAEAPLVLLHKITSVARCTDEAVKAWASF